MPAKKRFLRHFLLPVVAVLLLGAVTTHLAKEALLPSIAQSQTTTAQTYYVASPLNFPCASDDNNGLKPDCATAGSGPFATIMKAVSTTRAGGTILVRAGTYNEFVDIRDNNSQDDNAENLISLRNFPGETSVIPNIGNEFAVRFYRKKYWVLEGFNLNLGQNGGVVVFNSQQITVKNNRVHHGTGYGIKIMKPESYGNLIVRNSIYNMWVDEEDRHGISINQGAHNNVIRDNEQTGMRIYQTENIQIYNNTLARNTQGLALSDANNTSVKNNIFSEHTSNEFYVFRGGERDFTSDYNLFFDTDGVTLRLYADVYPC